MLNVARARDRVLVLGCNDLAADVARTLAERRAEAVGDRIVLAGSCPGTASDHRLRLLERGVSRRLADVLAKVRPAVLVQLAVSESAVRPRRTGRYDTVIADAVAAAVRLWHERGGRLRALITLSSTVVYGLARSSPLVFREIDDGDLAGLGPETCYGRWAGEMRHAEKTYREVAREVGSRLAVLRAAPVVGGPISSAVTELLAAPLGVRIAGYDPPVQVVHYNDLIEAIVLTIEQRPAETLNIASRGVVPLSRLGALAGRVLLPLPRVAAALLVPDALTTAALTWRCVADDSRAMQLLGFVPVFSAEEALRG